MAEYSDNSTVYGRRALLNPPGHHSGAAIVAEVSKRHGYWDTTLQISDCDRAVTLSLYGPDSEDHDHQADLYKIDTMIEALRELRKGLRRARRSCGR